MALGGRRAFRGTAAMDFCSLPIIHRMLVPKEIDHEDFHS